MHQYQTMASHVWRKGVTKNNRTGNDTLSVFGYQMRFDLAKGFPLVTTKEVHLPSVIHELLWFLSGDTNIKYLKDNRVRIWNEWATESGELGPIYGKQWTEWQCPNREIINQIAGVIEILKTNPNSRRMIVTAWNPADLPDESVSPQENVHNSKMALAACHAFFQFYVSPLNVSERENIYIEANKGKNPQEDDEYPAGPMKSYEEALHEYYDELNIPRYKLSCQVYQRSADVFLGVPFNIASYAMLTHMIAAQVNMVPDELIWTGGDVHIYKNTLPQIKEQLVRDPLPLPELILNPEVKSIFGYKFNDITVRDYQSHPAIKAEVSV